MVTTRLIELLGAYSLQLAALLSIGLILPLALRLRGPTLLLRYHQGLLLLALLLPVGAWLPALGDGARSGNAGALAGFEPLVITVTAGSVWFSWGSWALIAVGVGALVRLGWLAAGAAALRRARLAGRPHELTPAQTALCRRLCPHAQVLESPEVEVPATYGWRRPVILLPSRFAGLAEEARDGVVCHELIHCRRRDWLWVLLAETVRVLLWFHPAIWLLLDRIALFREQVVDRRVVELTGQRRAYLHALVDVAAFRRRAQLLAPLFMGQQHLRSRVDELLKEIEMTKSRTLATMILCAGIAGTAFLVVTNGVPLGAATAAGASEEAEPIRVEGDVVPPKRLSGDSPVYSMEARRAGIEGTVIVRVVIDTRGEVSETEVVKKLTDELDAAAVAAVETWKFEPATLEGEPVAVLYNLTINFRLG